MVYKCYGLNSFIYMYINVGLHRAVMYNVFRYIHSHHQFYFLIYINNY